MQFSPPGIASRRRLRSHPKAQETNGINKNKKLLGAAPDSIREKLSNNPPTAPQRHHRRRRCDNAGGWISTFWNKYFKVDLEWLTQSRGLLLVLATLMLCMSYQATMHVLSSLPGGVWQGSGNDDEIFALWIVLHSVGFMGSCSTIMLVLCGLPNRNKVYVWLLAFTFYIAVACMAATYGLALFKVGLAYFNPYPSTYQEFRIKMIASFIWKQILFAVLR